MKQYIELLKKIQEKGTYKPAARANMPGTQSLFGYQFRHNLADGFPLLTTKKISFKNVVTELLWFLRGDMNIKYLVDNGCNIWSEDSYNYYKKIACNETGDLTINNLYRNNGDETYSLHTFDQFCKITKNTSRESLPKYQNYTLGDCGFQYGRVWRKFGQVIVVDQIKALIEGLQNNPESRRHIVTAIDPSHDQDLALYWCHAMFQFNCRPLTKQERFDWTMKSELSIGIEDFDIVPKYYLDCQLYQRSADSVLGVPYNIASYALLTHIIAKICNMIPGEFIHSFGDLHIYDNHTEVVAEQLTREPKELPVFEDDWIKHFSSIDEFIENVIPEQIVNCLRRYNPEPSIKAELSTGLIK